MNRLWVRLALAFILVTLVGVGIVAGLSGISADREFRRFLQRQETLDQEALVEDLAVLYTVYGSWTEVRRELGMAGLMRRGGPMWRRAAGWIIADSDGRTVIDPNASGIGRQLDARQLQNAVPIVVNGETVGFLVPLRGDMLAMMLQAPAQEYLAQVRRSLWIAALVAGALGVALSIVLSRTLTAPLANLVQAAQRLARRDWRERVQPSGTEEIAAVALAFNQMADELQRQEILRRNMIADIAHELRTPLTVLQGNLRAMMDGVYPLERNEIATLYDETRLVSRLVEDLGELALADAGQLPLNLQTIDLVPVVSTAAANFAVAAEAGEVRFATVGLNEPILVRADPDRVGQILRNLLANALRHTPAGGSIELGAEVLGNGQVRVRVTDSGEGIAPEDLPHVFERFYRADKSRARATGGSGLGLAIAKAWVEAMGGAVGVESRLGMGSTFWFTLPAK